MVSLACHLRRIRSLKRSYFCEVVFGAGFVSKHPGALVGVNNPTGVRKQRNIADVVKVRMGKGKKLDVGRGKVELRELSNECSGDLDVIGAARQSRGQVVERIAEARIPEEVASWMANKITGHDEVTRLPGKRTVISE